MLCHVQAIDEFFFSCKGSTGQAATAASLQAGLVTGG
jgi:hypothetical protein